MPMTQTKNAPHSKETEMIILGSMLTSLEAFHLGSHHLSEEDFYYSEHKIIHAKLKETHTARKPADIHLLAEGLKEQGRLQEIGGIAYLTTLAQYAGTSAYMEEYIEAIKTKSLLRKMLAIGQNMAKSALENPSDPSSLLDRYKEEFDTIVCKSIRSIPIPLMESRLEKIEEKLKQLRGKKYLGLCQKTIPEIDEKFLGLRNLIVLAAAPNVGKTALTNQFAIDILKNNPDACVVYFSLEMTEEDLLIRLLCNQSELDYKTIVLGSGKTQRGLIREAFFSEEEMRSLIAAEKSLKALEARLQIIDREMCPFLTADLAIAHIEAVKQKTKCQRCFVVIDYLQVWPLNHQAKFFNENEIDKWRIGEAMKIRNALKGDPILVISEARKPQGDNKWGGDLSDVMGAARMTYSPDAVLLFSPLDAKGIADVWTTKGQIQSYQKKKAVSQQSASEEELEQILSYLEHKGIALCRLDMPKGRDGTQKFSLILEFHYRKNIFRPANFSTLMAAAKNHPRKPS